MRQWYAIFTTPHKELSVQSLLQARDLETYLPLIRPVRQRKGRRAFKPFFPRYLFVRVDLNDVGLSALNWIPGVESLVSFGGLPAIVPDGAIEVIRDRLAQETIQRGVNWAPGQRVRFREGPLQGLEAVFDRSLGPSGRVRVLMACMRQGWPAEVDSASLERIGEPRQAT